MVNLFWSFGPWLVFLIATRLVPIQVAVVLAFLAALVVIGRAVMRRHLHLLDVVGAVYFLFLGVAIVVLHPDLSVWARFAQAGSHAVITIVIFVTILIGRPFTESYARETVPRELWNTPRFHSLNRRISVVWGLAFLAGTASLLLAAYEPGDRVTLLRVIIPFGLLVGAYMYTQEQRQQARPLAEQRQSDLATAGRPEEEGGDPR